MPLSICYNVEEEKAVDDLSIGFNFHENGFLHEDYNRRFVEEKGIDSKIRSSLIKRKALNPRFHEELFDYCNAKLIKKGIVSSAKEQEAVETALKAQLVILNTAVAGKWLDVVLKENVPHVLPKHLPFAGGAMIDLHNYKILEKQSMGSIGV
uniref:Uncharacterized protein n=1 Tax=Cucumis melo TaxID=3656 RepID=A0A9I9EIC8_CUCME